MSAKHDLSTNEASIPVSIVSNSRLFREGLIDLLIQHVRIHLVGSYTNHFESLASPPNPEGHIVLLDSSMGQRDAMQWTKWWRRLTPPAQVLIMELAEDKDVILACIEAGASGYTLQGASTVEVADAVRCASQGTARCSPEMVAHVFARLATIANNALPTKSHIPLTGRELEVLQCIAKGFSNKEIATILFIELHTVKRHVHNILEKLDMVHRRDAARFAAEQGWLYSDIDAHTAVD